MKHLLILIMVIAVFLAGCGQTYVQGTDIPFVRIIDFSAWEGEFTGQYTQPTPMCIEASTTHDMDVLLAMLNRDGQQQVSIHGTSDVIIIACFLGLRRSGGEAISIQKIILNEHIMYIYARFETPQAGKLYEMGTRSPFSIVSIERSALPINVPLTIHLMDDATKQEVLVQEYTVK